MKVPSLLRDGEQTYLYRHLQASQGPLSWAGQVTHLVSAAAHVTPLQPNHAVGLGVLWPHQLLPETCGSRQPMHSSKWSGFGPLKGEPGHWSSSATANPRNQTGLEVALSGSETSIAVFHWYLPEYPTFLRISGHDARLFPPLRSYILSLEDPQQ